MNKKVSDKKGIEYAIYLLVVLMIFYGMYWYRIRIQSDQGLPFALQRGEELIDYTMEEPYIYTLVSKKGRPEYGDFFVVYAREGENWNRIYENDFMALMPWKIETADVDHDNEREILIAVRKTTYLDKTLKNRMFIFNYQDGILVKKWTGSQIAGNWREFFAGELLSAPGEELIFVEETEEGKEQISVYSWFDFGFFRIADSDAYPEIQSLTLSGDNSLMVSYMEEGRKRTLMLTAKAGKLTADD